MRLEADGEIEASEHRLVELREIVAGEHDRNRGALQQAVVLPAAAVGGRQHVFHLVAQDGRAGFAPEQRERHPEAVPLVRRAVHPAIGALRFPGAPRFGFAEVVETAASGADERLRRFGFPRARPAVEEQADTLTRPVRRREEANRVLAAVEVAERFDPQKRLGRQRHQTRPEFLFVGDRRTVDAIEPVLDIAAGFRPVPAPAVGIGDPDFRQPAQCLFDAPAGNPEKDGARFQRIAQGVLHGVPELLHGRSALAVETREFQQRTARSVELEAAHRERRGARLGPLGGWLGNGPLHGFDRPGQELLCPCARGRRTPVGSAPATAAPPAASEGEVGLAFICIIEPRLPELHRQESGIHHVEFVLAGPDPAKELRCELLVPQGAVERGHQVVAGQEAVIFLQCFSTPRSGRGR